MNKHCHINGLRILCGQAHIYRFFFWEKSCTSAKYNRVRSVAAAGCSDSCGVCSPRVFSAWWCSGQDIVGHVIKRSWDQVHYRLTVITLSWCHVTTPGKLFTIHTRDPVNKQLIFVPAKSGDALRWKGWLPILVTVPWWLYSICTHCSGENVGFVQRS